MGKRGIAEIREVGWRAARLGKRALQGTRRSVLAGKGGYFAAVAASGHRAPAASARSRIVVKDQAAMGIGANAKARAGPLCDNFGAGPGHGGKQPVKAALPRDEFYFPGAVLTYEFVVAFRDAQDFVYRLEPFPGNPVSFEHGGENLAQGRAEALGLQEEGFRSLGVGLRQGQKLGAALGGDNGRRLQEVNEALPRHFCVRRSRVGKINSESAAEQWM